VKKEKKDRAEDSKLKEESRHKMWGIRAGRILRPLEVKIKQEKMSLNDANRGWGKQKEGKQER